MRHLLFAPLAVLCIACAPGGTPDDGAPGPVCRVAQPPTPLADELAETSGVAASRTRPELLWTHNDSGSDPRLFAISPRGETIGSVAVENARNRDWEDIAAGPCPSGRCLYIGDIGDNEARRDEIAIYRVPEPRPGESAVRAERFRARYPGGARDAESLFVLPSGEIYLATKGRTSGVSIYRYPLPLRPDETVELEEVAVLDPDRRQLPSQLTGAAASPDGRWIALRDYVSLRLHRSDALLSGDTTPAWTFDLRSLDEPQGEAVEILDNGRVVLTTEGTGQTEAGLITVLACEIGRGR